MREIIHVQIGRCGNIIGKKFLQTILKEHQLDKRGVYYGNCPDLHLQCINVYFRQSENRYVPRAILIDQDSAHQSEILSQYFHQLIDDDNVLCGHSSTNGNWAKGFYGVKSKFLQSIYDIVQQEAEACDSMEGIQIVHGLGGGTGGGLGSLFANHLFTEYQDKIRKFYSVIPSRVYMSIPEVYNTVLTLYYLNDYIDEIFCMDYDSIVHLHKENQGEKSEYDWISNCMSGITTCLRFPCQLNTGLRKLLVNMVPFPTLHFFVPGYVETKQRDSPAAVLSITQKMFQDRNVLVNCTLANECFFTVAAIFRGKISPKDVDERMLHIQEKYKNNFVKWIPHNTKTAICEIIPCCERWSATSILNTTAIQQPFQALLDCFRKKVNEKWHLHWYTNEGMDESEFIDAQNNLDNLLSCYKQYSDEMGNR